MSVFMRVCRETAVALIFEEYIYIWHPLSNILEILEALIAHPLLILNHPVYQLALDSGQTKLWWDTIDC